jgi:glycosyltransferase involved in cell wall biosynthesis
VTADSDPSRPLAGRHIVVCNWRDSVHPRAGGAEQYCESVAEELAALGATVTYLTARPKGAPRQETRSWGRIVRMGGTLTTYFFVLAWLELHRRRIDGVIDSQNGIPAFSPLAVGPKVPVALLIHHVHQDQFDRYFPRPFNLVGKFLEKQVSRWVYGRRPVCVVSPSTRASVRRRLGFKGSIFIAPNGLSRPQVDHGVSRSTSPSVVAVGRLVPHKRLDLLLDALPTVQASCPRTVLHIVGDGECRAALEQQARRLGLTGSVIFHGRTTDHERDRLVAQAWVTVNPSAGEGWGLSVIEAAAFGVPAVAFRVAGLEDSVRPGETGWLVDPGQDLADVVSDALLVLSDSDVAEKWAARCQAWASSFTWAYTAERLADVIEGEAKRIKRRYDERRSVTDSTTVVVLPPETLDPPLLAELRTTDQVRLDLNADRVEVLLAGADEHDAMRAMGRLGIQAEHMYGTRIARYRDHLGWQSKAVFARWHRHGLARSGVDMLGGSDLIDLRVEQDHSPATTDPAG